MASSVLTDLPLKPAEREHIRTHWPASTVVASTTELSGPELDQAIANAELFLGRMAMAKPEVLRAAKNLKVLHMVGHGVDGLLKPEIASVLVEQGIRVATASSAGDAIAEYVVMSMIGLNRHLSEMHLRLALHGEWKPYRQVPEIGGATACVLGLGSVGEAIVRKSAAMGMRVIGVTRDPGQYPDGVAGAESIVSLADAGDAVREADHVIVALPLKPQTRGLVDGALIDKFKDGATLINIARGEIIDDDALYDALASGKLGGAALDAWTGDRQHAESYPSRRPLHHFNVIMTPHCSASSAEARFRALSIVGENIRRLESGATLVNEVPASVLGAGA